MYAILQQSGHQYRVSPGDRLLVDRLAAEVGSVVALEPVVLVAADDGTPQVGTPVVDGVRVAATVVGHTKGGKIRVFKYKPKKRYRRTHGHRSLLTELRVEAVLAAGEALPEPKVAEAKPAKAAAPAGETPKRKRATASAAAGAAETETSVPAETSVRAETSASAESSVSAETSVAAETSVSAEASAPAKDSLPAEAPEAPEAAAPKPRRGKAAADEGAQGATPATDDESPTPKRRTRAKKTDDTPAADSGETE